MSKSQPDFILEFTPNGYKDEHVVASRDGLMVSRKYSILSIDHCRFTWPVTITLHTK